jgi:hypothetical protein
MASVSTNIKSYNIDSYEYFRNVEKISPKPSSIKAYIPKYMPYVTEGKWQTPYPITLGDQMNASECKVQLPIKVTEQGYVTLNHYDNETPDFTSKATKDSSGNLIVLPGNTFMAEVLYNDPTDIKFTGKV